MHVYWNNKLIDIQNKLDYQLFDRGFQFGDGVYETIAVKDGKAVFLDEHITRLADNADKIDIPVSKDFSEWSGNVDNIIKSNNFDEGFIKIIITRGLMRNAGLSYPDPVNPSVFIWGQECQFLPFKEKKPFRVTISQHERRNPYSLVTYIKSTDYLTNVIAKNEADVKGCDEAIFLNTEGNLCEGTTSNIFLIENERKIITPEVKSGILRGVVRDKVIETAIRNNIEVDEKYVSLDDAKNARGCFLTSSLIGITPVEEIIGVAEYDVSKYSDILELIDSKYENSGEI